MGILDSAIALDKKRSASKQESLDGIMALFAGMLASAAERQGAQKSEHEAAMTELRSGLDQALFMAQEAKGAVALEASARAELAQQVASIKAAPVVAGPAQVHEKKNGISVKPMPISYSMDVKRGQDGLIKSVAVSGGETVFDLQVVRGKDGLLQKVNVIPRGH